MDILSTFLKKKIFHEKLKSKKHKILLTQFSDNFSRSGKENAEKRERKLHRQKEKQTKNI